MAQLEGPSELETGRSAQGALRAKLARGLHSSMREALGRWKRSELLHRAAGALKSFTLSLDQSGQWTVGIDVAPAKGRADTGHVEIDLPELAVDLAGAALSRGVGVLVCVDEMQQLPAPDLAALCAACHEAGQREVPFYVAGAGLPGLPAVLASAKSYAERLFAYSRLGPLGAEDAARALRVPARAQGVTWRRAALDLVVEQSGAYPFFLQTYGQHTWDAAVGPSAISLDDARVGSALAAEQLDLGFHLSRWERATPFQRVYLRAMAVGDGRAHRRPGTSPRGWGGGCQRRAGPRGADRQGLDLLAEPRPRRLHRSRDGRVHRPQALGRSISCGSWPCGAPRCTRSSAGESQAANSAGVPIQDFSRARS